MLCACEHFCLQIERCARAKRTRIARVCPVVQAETTKQNNEHAACLKFWGCRAVTTLHAIEATKQRLCAFRCMAGSTSLLHAVCHVCAFACIVHIYRCGTLRCSAACRHAWSSLRGRLGLPRLCQLKQSGFRQSGVLSFRCCVQQPGHCRKHPACHHAQQGK